MIRWLFDPRLNLFDILSMVLLNIAVEMLDLNDWWFLAILPCIWFSKTIQMRFFEKRKQKQ